MRFKDINTQREYFIIGIAHKAGRRSTYYYPAFYDGYMGEDQPLGGGHFRKEDACAELARMANKNGWIRLPGK